MTGYLGSDTKRKAPHLIDERMALGKSPLAPCVMSVPAKIQKHLRVLSLAYFSFDGDIHIGQLVVHQNLVDSLRDIFLELLHRRFPIFSIVPIAVFGWDDVRSMQANNTSAFNYRYIAGTVRLSWHAYGRALDINPRQNPCIQGGCVTPTVGCYDISMPGTMTEEVANIFLARGFRWGGHWQSHKDYMHFEMP